MSDASDGMAELEAWAKRWESGGKVPEMLGTFIAKSFKDHNQTRPEGETALRNFIANVTRAFDAMWAPPQ